MSKAGRLLAAATLVITVAEMGLPSEKKDFSERYKDKYFVVMRDGLSLGICADDPNATPFFRPRITESGVDTSKHGFLEKMPEGEYDVCDPTPEPVHKGEVLVSSRAGIRGKWLTIVVHSLSAHSVTRGTGAFEHESHEYPSAFLMFSMDGGYDQAATLVDQWLRTFDTEEKAAKFGNTASGTFVKEVKLGMTAAEVEAALGLPETRVDLGKKVLYKYKNMTVEFEDGKVTDVR